MTGMYNVLYLANNTMDRNALNRGSQHTGHALFWLWKKVRDTEVTLM